MKNKKGIKTKDNKIIKLIAPKYYSNETPSIILDDSNEVVYEKISKDKC